jgi:hypothetical protein
MAIKKEDVLKYLSDTRSHYLQYHNHKEASAWAAAALYILFLIQISTAIKEKLSCDLVYLVMGFIVVIGVAVFIYLQAQFSMRRNAANYIAACFALIVEYLHKEDIDIGKDGDVFKLEETTDNNHHSPHILPKVILTKARHFDTIGHGTRKRLEWSIYIVLIIITFAVLMRVRFM